MKDYLLNRIWEEIKQSSTNVIYADLLIDKQITNSKIYNCCIALISSGGAIFSLVSLYIPVVTSILVAIVSIINQFHPIIFMKTDDLTKLCSLRTDYNIYFNKLQDLFCLANSGKITPEEAQKEFSCLTEENANKQTDISRLFGNIKRKLNIIAASKSDKYLNSIYNG